MSVTASIDIGTNTALLLVAQVEQGNLVVIREEQRVPRLGKGVDKHGKLSDESIGRVISAVGEYRRLLLDEYPEVREVIVTGTSAVRDASNRVDLVRALKRETGFDLRILSGEEEAGWTFAGALSMLPEELRTRETAVLDIGGGSTEVALGIDHTIQDRFSFSMGSIRFTERYLPADPPSPGQIEICKESVQEQLEQHLFAFPNGIQVVGVAGTVTSLAFMKQKLHTYDPKRISNYILYSDDIRHFMNYFSMHTAQQALESWPVVMNGRADVMLAGLLILDGFMKKYSIHELRVSTGGIRHGAVLMG